MVNQIQIAKLFARMGYQFGSVFVAASNAPAWVKLIANYNCDGTADEVEINAAITAANGGKVVLSSGTFIIANKISLTSNTSLEGQGSSTIIKVANSTHIHAIELNGVLNVKIRNLTVDGNYSNQSALTAPDLTASCINVTGVVSRIKIIDCELTNSIGHGLLLQGGTQVYNSGIIANNQIYGNRQNGIHMTPAAEYFVISNNVINGNILTGININGTTNLQLVGNNITDNGNYGIYSIGSAMTNPPGKCIINSNTVNHNTNGGIYLTSHNYITLSANSVMANPQGHGIFLESCSFITIVGGVLGANSYQAANTYDEIRLKASTYCAITAVTLYPYQTNKAKYCINESDGSNANTVSLCSGRNGATGGINLIGGGSVNVNNHVF
jgi:parallel beta-helix repeat protein